MGEEEKKKKSFLKSGAGIAICIAVLATLGVGGYYFLHYESEYVWTNDAQIEGFAVNLSSDVMARIQKLEVDEGDRVSRDQLICTMQEDIVQAEVVEAEAKVVSMEANIAVKKASLIKLEQDFMRAEQAYADQIISVQQWDHATQNFEMARAEYEQSIADFALAKAQVEVLQHRLFHHKVYAPFDGVIVKRWAMNGDVVDPGQSIFSMYDLENIWIIARLDETKVENVRIGSPVRITIDAYPGVEFTGKVFVIKGAAASTFSFIPSDNATGNYTKVAQRVPIKISLDKPDRPIPTHYLFPGLSAEVKIKVR